MANMQTAAQGAPVMDEAAMAEMRRLIFEAPIQELADAQGISIDEAVQLRVEKNLEAAEVPIEVSVRPIEPQGKLIGFASVNIGGIVIDDFKVVNGKNGIFLGEPSKPDPTPRTGYRSTARVTNRALQERLSAAAALTKSGTFFLFMLLAAVSARTEKWGRHKAGCSSNRSRKSFSVSHRRQTVASIRSMAQSS